MKHNKTVKYIPLMFTFDEQDADKWTSDTILNHPYVVDGKDICSGPYARGAAFRKLYPFFDLLNESEDRKDIIRAWLIRVDEDGSRTVMWQVESRTDNPTYLADMEEINENDEFYHYQVDMLCSYADRRGDDTSSYWYTNDAGERMLDWQRLSKDQDAAIKKEQAAVERQEVAERSARRAAWLASVTP